MGVNLKSLIGKLNDSTRSALEGAAGLCLSRTHYDIEVEHYLMKLLESTDGDFEKIVRHFGVDTSRLAAELTRSLDKLKSGNARTPAISPTVMKMFTEAWTIGSIDFGSGQIRTGFTILALATETELARLMREVSREFQKIQADALMKDFASIVADSREEAYTAAAADRLGAFDWPGNVRQLRNVIERAVVLARGRELGRHDFPLELFRDLETARHQASGRTLREVEADAIKATLSQCDGNKSRAARILGMSRKALYKRLREFEGMSL